MFRIAVCDDEKIFSKKIERIILDYAKEKGCCCEVHIFHSGKEFVDLGIEIIKYDIVFLDINMDELDGLSAAQKIRAVSNEIFIVFVTAYVTYAVDGYKVDAARYILKNNVNFAETIYECLDSISAKMNYVIRRKEFNFNEGKRNISLDYLLYIESKLHKLEFHVMEDKLNVYTLYKTLNEMEKELAGAAFVRIHQSYLVNMKHIKKISRYHVLLSNGMVMDIPRARYKTVEERFVAYKGEL